MPSISSEIMTTVLDSMPAFPERESVLEARLAKAKVAAKVCSARAVCAPWHVYWRAVCAPWHVYWSVVTAAPAVLHLQDTDVWEKGAKPDAGGDVSGGSDSDSDGEAAAVRRPSVPAPVAAPVRDEGDLLGLGGTPVAAVPAAAPPAAMPATSTHSTAGVPAPAASAAPAVPVVRRRGVPPAARIVPYTISASVVPWPPYPW
jgi:hypothetical protein